MKQRTYWITLHLFDHLAQSLPTPEKFEKTKRNLSCATPLRSRGLSSLTSLSSHNFYTQQIPPLRCAPVGMTIHLGNDTSTRAAFVKESRMKFADATNINRKSGVA